MIKTGRPSLIQKKKRKVLYLHSAISIAAVLFVIIGVVSIFRLDGLKISHIEIKGNKEIPKSGIQKITESELLGNYLYFLPKRNSIFFPRSKIEHTLLDEYRGISSVDASFKYWDRITIDIKERDEYALWCSEFPETNCFSLDASGFIYRKAVIADKRVILSGYISDKKIIGSYYLGGSKEAEELFMFISELTKLGIIIERVNFNSEKDFEFYYKGGGKILVSSKITWSETRNNFQEILRHSDFKNKEAALSSMEYIDLRFGNKVFYKARQQQLDNDIKDDGDAA